MNTENLPQLKNPTAMTETEIQAEIAVINERESARKISDAEATRALAKLQDVSEQQTIGKLPNAPLAIALASMVGVAGFGAYKEAKYRTQSTEKPQAGHVEQAPSIQKVGDQTNNLGKTNISGLMTEAPKPTNNITAKEKNPTVETPQDINLTEEEVLFGKKPSITTAEPVKKVEVAPAQKTPEEIRAEILHSIQEKFHAELGEKQQKIDAQNAEIAKLRAEKAAKNAAPETDEQFWNRVSSDPQGLNKALKNADETLRWYRIDAQKQAERRGRPIQRLN